MLTNFKYLYILEFYVKKKKHAVKLLFILKIIHSNMNSVIIYSHFHM